LDIPDRRRPHFGNKLLVLGLATDARCCSVATSLKALSRQLGVGSDATPDPKVEIVRKHLG